MKKTTYAQGQIAVDAVILTVQNGKLLVFLRQREKDPYQNTFELPGGLLLQNETAEETLARKLKDIIGTKNIFFQQFHTFTNPRRDPRGRTVSIGFIALLSTDKIPDIGKFHLVEALPELAFDHDKIIKAAVKFLKTNRDSVMIHRFMPDLFPLNDLQTVYEVIGQRKLDNRNFRKKVLELKTVVKVRQAQKNVSHRPATLYRFR